jgi:HSP20 family protein
MSENVLYYPKPAPVYPGMYNPIQRKEELLHKLNKKGIRIFKPPVNIIELPDHYRIEMTAPGFKREDFFIKTNGCSLSIEAAKRQSGKTKDERYRFRSFHYDYIKRDIELPDNVDPDFGTAEYKNGVLNIYLYKNSYQAENRPGQIIVY